jgi:hypothetical protein
MTRNLLGAATSIALALLAMAMTPAAAQSVPSEPPAIAPEALRYQRYFALAAAEFDVPVEILEAVAYVESRWQHRGAEPAHDPSPRLPESIGIMGLRDAAFFGATLDEAARLLGTTPATLARDAYQNVRGAAALLRKYGPGRARATTLAQWEPAIARLSGIPDAAVAQMHTHEVFAAIRDGRVARDYRVTRRAVDLERLFGAVRSRELAQPFQRVPRAGAATADIAIAAAGADQPGALWSPAATCNFRKGRTSAATHVVIHTIQGSYAGAIAWFKNCAASASSHYVVRSSDGQVTQMVAEADTAFHARAANAYAIGIEHEGFVDAPARWYTEAMIEASAALARGILGRLGRAPRVFDGLAGWNAVLARDAFNVVGHVNLANQSHTDPGAGWDWPRYRWLVDGAPIAARAVDLFDAGARVIAAARGAADDDFQIAFAAGASAFGAFGSLGGPIGSRPITGMNADGRVEVFMRAVDGALVHKWEKTPGGVWSNWHALGGALASEPAVARHADGRLAVFVRGTDDAVYTNAQLVPNGSWGGWRSLGGTSASVPVVATNADGRLAVFVRTPSGTLAHVAETAPGGAWAAWESLGGAITDAPTLARNQDGRLEVFARGADGLLKQIWQRTPGGLWSAWWNHGGEITSATTVVAHVDGRLEVFARAGDGALYASLQNAPNGTWAAWFKVAGFIASAPAAIVRADGRLDVLVLGVDGYAYSTSRATPGAAFSPWTRLGGPFDAAPAAF